MDTTRIKYLFLILKGEYFDEILAGRKPEEFRAVTEYWKRRIEGREYETILFQRGYRSDAPRMEVEYLGYDIKQLTHKHFGDQETPVYALKLGEIKWHSIPEKTLST